MRDPAPHAYGQLPGAGSIRVTPAVDEGYDAVFVIECSDIDRPGLSDLEKQFVVNIDHHSTTELFGAVNWIDGVGLRPEVLRLARGAPASDPFREATVLRSVFLGNCLQVHLRLASGEEVVAEIARSAEMFQAGDAVYACWRSADQMEFS